MYMSPVSLAKNSNRANIYRTSSDWKVGEITCHIAGILKPGNVLAGIRHFVMLETPRRTHVHFQHGKFSNLPDIPPPVLQDLIRELAKCWLLHYLMPTSLLNFPFILVSPSYARYRISTTLLLVNREERSLNTAACSSSYIGESFMFLPVNKWNKKENCTFYFEKRSLSYHQVPHQSLKKWIQAIRSLVVSYC